jgi:hypothetical protein
MKWTRPAGRVHNASRYDETRRRGIAMERKHISPVTALALALLPMPAAAQSAGPAAEKSTAQEPAKETPKATDKPAVTPASIKSDGAAKSEAMHPFAALAGSWSGGGTLSTSSGTRERLRCRAHYTVGQGGKSLNMSIRCAGDSYRFDLNSSVVDRRGRIFGRWSESSYNVSGSVSGTASGSHIRAMARGDSFSAGLAVTLHGGRHTVTISPQGTFITAVHVAFRKG